MNANCIILLPDASKAAAPGLRRCLACRSPFASGGPHERVCPRCKESEIWQAGVCEYAVHPQTNPGGEAE